VGKKLHQDDTAGRKRTIVLAGQPKLGRRLACSCWVQFTTQWRDILSDRHLNGIIIATPPALHAEMAYAAVKVGLGVMVEKPLSLNLEEALSLYDVVAQYKGCVFVDHTYLFHPATEN